jgi:hypothetical protein
MPELKAIHCNSWPFIKATSISDLLQMPFYIRFARDGHSVPKRWPFPATSDLLAYIYATYT